MEGWEEDPGYIKRYGRFDRSFNSKSLFLVAFAAIILGTLALSLYNIIDHFENHNCECVPEDPHNPSCCAPNYNKVRASVTPELTGSVVNIPFVTRVPANAANTTILDLGTILVDSASIINLTENKFVIPRNGTYELSATICWFDDIANITNQSTTGLVSSFFKITPDPNLPAEHYNAGKTNEYLLQDGPLTSFGASFNIINTVNTVVLNLYEGNEIELGLSFITTTGTTDSGVYVVCGINGTSIVADNYTDLDISSVSVVQL